MECVDELDPPMTPAQKCLGTVHGMSLLSKENVKPRAVGLNYFASCHCTL